MIAQPSQFAKNESALKIYISMPHGAQVPRRGNYPYCKINSSPQEDSWGIQDGEYRMSEFILQLPPQLCITGPKILAKLHATV